MAFKIPNFSKQMGGSPLNQKGSPAKNLKGSLLGGLASLFTKKVTVPMVKSMAGVEDQVEEVVPEEVPVESASELRGRKAWSEHGDDLSSLTAAQQELENAGEKGSNQWNINQNKINELYGVSKRHPVEEVEVNVEEEVEPIEDVVDPSAHVPSEGIKILSGKQKRAARRVARLRAKARNKGGLTEGQSKRLNRNISKAKGEDVAYSDKTNVGQFLKGKPVDDTEFTAANMDPYGDDDPFEV